MIRTKKRKKVSKKKSEEAGVVVVGIFVSNINFKIGEIIIQV
jgi:hypothetical protein